MICSQRGALSKYLWRAWEEATAFVTKWNGFLPRVGVVITGEIIGAALAETITPLALSATDKVLESYLPLYRQIPLIVGTAALPIIVILGAGKVSNVTLALFAVSIPLIFRVGSLKDIEESTSEIAGTIIHYLACMFASITGGFLGLKLTSDKLGHSTENFSDYRAKMVWHAIAGLGFEVCITPANRIVLKIARSGVRSLLQTVAYNGVDFWRSFKASVRKEKTYGVIAPVLTKALYERFESIKRKELADEIVATILPFFSKGQASLFSSTFIEPLIIKKLEELQNESGSLTNTLTRSLIEYISILQTPDIHRATTTLFNLLSTDSSKKIINAATGELIELLNKAVALNSPSTSYPIEMLGEAFLNEERATDLSQLICAQLNDLGTFLMGHPVYPEHHFKAIESLIQVHLKPFVKFAILRLLNLPSSDEPLSPIEDIKLTSIVQHILFSTVVEPLLSPWLVSGGKKILNASLSLTVGTIHKLQGFKPSAQMLAPLLVLDNYIETQPPQTLETPLIPGADFEIVQTPPPIDNIDDCDYTLVSTPSPTGTDDFDYIDAGKEDTE